MLEFEWVEYLKTRMVGRADIALGIGDDAALLQVSAGKLIAISTDTLVQGTHFLPGTPAAYMGHKALAVNLSDLAAMGATPRWFTMALSLPAPDALALEPFLDGLLDLADAHEISLVGGDTTRGPLAITITVLGEIAPGLALQRSHARVGDGIYVSGTLGDAAAALAMRLASSSTGSTKACWYCACLHRCLGWAAGGPAAHLPGQRRWRPGVRAGAADFRRPARAL
jgi:thiamine-monophosphate kinase